MGRTVARWLGCACLLLGAHAAVHQALASVSEKPSQTGAAYDFAYRLSGDRRVAPVQVFDDGRTTWLQFQPGQTLPAVFVSAQAGSSSDGQLASYTQQGPYLVLNGTADTLVLRIGGITARAEYIGRVPRTGLAAATSATPSQWADEAAMAVPVPSVEAPATLAARRAGQIRQAVAMPAPPGSIAQESSVLEFDVSLSDRNMRTALARWARQAGWTFQPEHWATDVDIPLAGVAAFGADFRHAVRTLLSATEMAERPLQPCFYSNRVLRVVPLSQACDRTAAPGAGNGRS